MRDNFVLDQVDVAIVVGYIFASQVLITIPIWRFLLPVQGIFQAVRVCLSVVSASGTEVDRETDEEQSQLSFHWLCCREIPGELG